MKKSFFVFLFIMTSFIVFSQNGVIREMAGSVEIKRAGDANFIAASVGDNLREDTIISTGFRSTALIEVGSALLTVRPLTRLSLTEIRSSAGAEAINVNLQAGRIRVDLAPPAGTRADMQITSPVATASVRGTRFDFDTRNLWVHSGSVEFYGNRGPRWQVGSGSSSNLAEDGRASDPIKIRRQRLRPPPPAGTDSSVRASEESGIGRQSTIIIQPLYIKR